MNARFLTSKTTCFLFCFFRANSDNFNAKKKSPHLSGLMKILTLLRTLKPTEHDEFQHFVKSNFFKLGERYAKFFRLLCKQHPTFDASKADLEAIYKQSFGKATFNDSKLFNLLSGLSRQVEDFLVVKMLLSEQGTSEKGRIWKELLVKALGNRNAGAYFLGEAERLIEEINSRPAKGLEDYLSLEQLHHQVYFNPDTPKHKLDVPNLQLSVENLDLYYCIAKLRNAAEEMARERLFQVRYEPTLLDAALEHTAAPKLLDTHPLAALYNRMVHLYLHGINEQDFRAFILFYIEKLHLLPTNDHQLLLHHLLNYGILLHEQNCELHDEMLVLYKIAIDANLLLDGNCMTNTTFINIVLFAALCKDFDWGRAFMDKFSPYLETGKHQPAIDLSEANLYYYQGMLDQAQSSLTAEIYYLPVLDVLARGLFLKIIFDRYVQVGKNYKLLDDHLNAFEHFVNNKQMKARKKNAHLNSIQFVRKMVAVKFEKLVVPELDKEKLRSMLEGLQPIDSRNWLFEKIETL